VKVSADIDAYPHTPPTLRLDLQASAASTPASPSVPNTHSNPTQSPSRSVQRDHVTGADVARHDGLLLQAGLGVGVPQGIDKLEMPSFAGTGDAHSGFDGAHDEMRRVLVRPAVRPYHASFVMFARNSAPARR